MAYSEFLFDVNLENNTKNFRFSTPRQNRIYRRLLLVGPGAAGFYKDACRLIVANPRFDATTHLVSHLLREIESSLRDVLEPFIETATERPKGGKETHIWEITAILKGLEIPESNLIAQAWLQLPNSDYALHTRAHREDLSAPRRFDEKFHEFWEEMEGILDFVLERFEARYLETHKRLDELLTKTKPTNEDAKWLRLNTPNNPVSFGYFFNKLNNPLWLRPLIAEGLFRYPAEPVVEEREEGNLIHYPQWPQSRYLARMAAIEIPVVQQMVAEVMLEIESENFLIHLDILEAATKLRPELAVGLAEREIGWLGKQDHIGHLLPDKLSELMVHLATGGQTATALNIARTILAVLPNPPEEEGRPRGWAIEPQKRLEMWDYGRVVRKCVRALTEHAGQSTLELFTEFLETAIVYSHPDREITRKEDHSEIWRRGIDSDSEGLKNILLTAIRDSSELQIKTEPARIIEIINFLESRQWLVFKRLALHLLLLFPENAGGLIADRLTTRDNFEERELWHEYILLARNHFASLKAGQQENILSWIDETPGIEVVKENRKNWDGRLLTDEEADQTIRWRKLKQLEPLQDVLPKDWKDRYDAWVAELGRPEHTEYSTPPTQFRMGYSSPQTSEELQSKSVDEIVEFLSNWQPSDNDPLGPSPEGLGQELSSVVASEPQKFSDAAELFRGIDPTYVRALFSGLNSALGKSFAISWSPVLSLSVWVLSQPFEIEKRAGTNQDGDENWDGVRMEIAHLLSAGLKTDVENIPFSSRDAAWAAIKESLTDQRLNPRPDDEMGSYADPLELSVNSVSGENFRLVIKYAYWVRHHLEKMEDSAERVSRGFDEMPEVREVLDSYLNPEIDSSLAIRTVYGEHLTGLIFLDQSWVQDNLSRIFPKEKGLEHLYEAVWETYLISSNYYDQVVELLKEEYFYAVQTINNDSLFDDSHLTHPRKKLTEHVIGLYFRNLADLDDPQSLISQFYTNASEELRSFVFLSIGQFLQNIETEKIGPEVLEKIQTLVDHRIEKIKVAESDSGKTELMTFGWIFASGKMDPAWAINRLKITLDLVGYSEFDDSVVEYLAELADDFPAQAIECLATMIDGVAGQWTVSYWAPRIRKIMEMALKTDSRELAIELIHKLGARGYLEFKDLLIF